MFPKNLTIYRVLFHHYSVHVITLTSHGRHSVSNHRWVDRLFLSLFLLTQINTGFTLPTFVIGIHRWLVDSPHKGPVMRKAFQYHDDIMWSEALWQFTSCIPSWMELPIIPMLTEWRCVDGMTAGIKPANIATTNQQVGLASSVL